MTLKGVHLGSVLENVKMFLGEMDCEPPEAQCGGDLFKILLGQEWWIDSCGGDK